MDITRVLSQVSMLLSIAEQCTNVLNLSIVGNDPHTNNMIGKVTQIIRAASQITAGAQQVTGGIENIANGNDPDISQMVSGVNQAINGSKSAIDGLSDIIWKPTTQTSLLVKGLEKLKISAVKIDSREKFCERVQENLEGIKQAKWEIKPQIQIRKGSPLQDIKTKFQNVYISGGDGILHRG